MTQATLSALNLFRQRPFLPMSRRLQQLEYIQELAMVLNLITSPLLFYVWVIVSLMQKACLNFLNSDGGRNGRCSKNWRQREAREIEVTPGTFSDVHYCKKKKIILVESDIFLSHDVNFRFSYYTAGTGGAGPTILATSFLLLGEEVTAYKQGKCLHNFKWNLKTSLYSTVNLFCNFLSLVLLGTWSGEKVKLKPYSGMINVDFGKGIRKRDVYLL